MDKGIYIAHHGIKGQKWGDRNGPPYPLTSSQKSTKEKKAKDDSQDEKIKKSEIFGVVNGVTITGKAMATLVSSLVGNPAIATGAAIVSAIVMSAAGLAMVPDLAVKSHQSIKSIN